MSASRSISPPRNDTDLSGNKPRKFNNGWTKEQEELMAGWADISASYRWMHDKGDKKMSRSNLFITVPVIILSTLTGSANFMLQSVVNPSDQSSQKYAQIAIGSVSIFTGILTTLGNFFRYAQNSESNRVASIAWGKFQRQIAIELALHPKERIDSMDFLKICRSDLDRLIEQSPPIPDDIINDFEKEFEDIKDFKRPDIAHGVDHTKVFDSKDSRLAHVAVDAAMLMKQKRKVWHEAMMPDVNKHINKVIADLSGSVINTMHERVNQLEEIVMKQKRSNNASATRSLSRVNQRGRSVPPMSPMSPMPPMHPLRQQSIHHVIPGSKETSSNDLISALTSQQPRLPSTDPLTQAKVSDSIDIIVPDDTNIKVDPGKKVDSAPPTKIQSLQQK